MVDTFDCPENPNTQLRVDSDDENKIISILTPRKNGFRAEWLVCLEGEELARFKKVVAAL